VVNRNGSGGSSSTAGSLIHDLVLGLSSNRHVDLAAGCIELGLPEVPPETGPTGGDSPGLTKAERLDAVFAGICSEDYLKVLQRFVDQGLPPEARNAAEDLIWSSQLWPAVDARTRREVAQALEAAGPFWSDPDGLLTSVERRFVDHDPGGVWTGRGLIDEVSQHMLRNDDWTALDLFKRIGARDSPSNPASEHEHDTLCGTSQLVRPDLRPAGRQCRGRGRFGRLIPTV
jgi:hypothetical protein